MPIQPTEKIWRNGQLIPWEQANIHVMSHVVHYGSSVLKESDATASPPERPSSGCQSICSA